MKIELKRFEYNEVLSEGSNSFTADLVIDGRKAGIASNNGSGELTTYLPLNEEGQQLIEKAEAYTRKLPSEVLNEMGIKPGAEMSLEKFIDRLVYRQITEKDAEKIRNKVSRAMANGVVFGVEDKSFRLLSIKVPIGMLLVHPNGHSILQNILAKRVIPYMEDYEKILNTNIPESILKAAGLQGRQYVKPVEPPAKEVKAGKTVNRKI